MAQPLKITLETGLRSFYTLERSGLGLVTIEQGRGGRTTHYADLPERGQTAISHFMDQYERYERFFEAVRKISITEYHSGRLNGFIERHDADDDFADAYELVAEMIEEADRKEEPSDG